MWKKRIPCLFFIGPFLGTTPSSDDIWKCTVLCYLEFRFSIFPAVGRAKD